MAKKKHTYEGNHEIYERVTSTYTGMNFFTLEEVCKNIDFRHPRFNERCKRNRSLGSAQAFIVELALQDEQFMNKLKTYMKDGGKNFRQYTGIKY